MLAPLSITLIQEKRGAWSWGHERCKMWQHSRYLILELCKINYIPEKYFWNYVNIIMKIHLWNYANIIPKILFWKVKFFIHNSGIKYLKCFHVLHLSHVLDPMHAFFPYTRVVVNGVGWWCLCVVVVLGSTLRI